MTRTLLESMFATAEVLSGNKDNVSRRYGSVANCKAGGGRERDIPGSPKVTTALTFSMVEASSSEAALWTIWAPWEYPLNTTLVFGQLVNASVTKEALSSRFCQFPVPYWSTFTQRTGDGKSLTCLNFRTSLLPPDNS